MASRSDLPSLNSRLSDPAVIANNREYAALARERSQLEEVAMAIRGYRRLLGEIDNHKALLEGDDAELRELAKAELPSMQREQVQAEEHLMLLLAPRDPNDEKNVVLEIRAGTGGEEASLFAGDLFRMYSRYAERHRWKIEALSLSNTGLGEIKEVVALITGRGAYSRLKFGAESVRCRRARD